MRIQTFIGKSNIEGLHQMDEHINEWMRRNKVNPTMVRQSCGQERHHGQNDEPVVIITIWYEGDSEDIF